MKYIKTYEDRTHTKYQKGDMVIIDSDWLYNIAEIIRVIPVDYNYSYLEETIYILQAKILNTKGQQFTTLPVTDKEIIRKATPEEMEQYYLEKNIKKYNL